MFGAKLARAAFGLLLIGAATGCAPSEGDLASDTANATSTDAATRWSAFFRETIVLPEVTFVSDDAPSKEEMRVYVKTAAPDAIAKITKSAKDRQVPIRVFLVKASAVPARDAYKGTGGLLTYGPYDANGDTLDALKSQSPLALLDRQPEGIRAKTFAANGSGEKHALSCCPTPVSDIVLFDNRYWIVDSRIFMLREGPLGKPEMKSEWYALGKEVPNDSLFWERYWREGVERELMP